MKRNPLFLSLIFVNSNHQKYLHGWLQRASEVLEPLVEDYEIVVIDNASGDSSVEQLRSMVLSSGFANVQVYALANPVEKDIATTVGIENAIGDLIAVIDPLIDDFSLLPKMLEKALQGHDVVFARNTESTPQALPYRLLSGLYSRIYQRLHGYDLLLDAPSYRLLSKRVVTYILEHPQAELAYRHLPMSHGFKNTTLTYSHKPSETVVKGLLSSMDKGSRLLVSTSHAPLRLVNALSLFGAASNVLYSMYVVAIWLFKNDVAPGWVSLSLQQSGMFFLISLVLLVLGEYIVNMGTQSQRGPRYHIGQEFHSERLTQREKLNIERPSAQEAPW